MKQCAQCGQFCEDGASFCTNCGTPLSRWPSPSAVSTKKEFLQLPENSRLKKELNSDAIVCYICAALTVILGVFVLKSPYFLIDVIIVLGMGLGIHLKQSKVCAVILCIYAVINTILGLINNGKISGYLLLIAGIYSVISTFKLDKQWKQYQHDHSL